MDSRYRPISGAMVRLVGKGTNRSEASNGPGYFDFFHVPLGIYTLTVDTKNLHYKHLISAEYAQNLGIVMMPK